MNNSHYHYTEANVVILLHAVSLYLGRKEYDPVVCEDLLEKIESILAQALQNRNISAALEENLEVMKRGSYEK